MAKLVNYSSPKTDAEYRADADGHTLMEAQEIRNDPKRHKAAMACLKKDAAAAGSAVELESKVSKGLKAAFPKDKKHSSNPGGY
jgi:hypothetical protein